MSSPRKQDKASLFFAILYNSRFDIDFLINRLSKKFGEILFISKVNNFKYTNYYEFEMGSDLKRIFILFNNKFDKDILIKVKKFTDKLEKKYSVNKKRKINIDPGIFTIENLVLATNKGYTHRVYLGNGVYADLTLFYKNKTYKASEWTFKEYKDEENIKMFNILRKKIIN